MTDDRVADLARTLVDAATAGRDVSRLVRQADHGDMEAYRDAAAAVWMANQEPDAGPDELLVDDDALGRIVRVFRRDDALALLYEAEQRRRAPDTATASDQAADLAGSVWDDRAELDAHLEEAATGWRVARMAPVDRAVLRIATWELSHLPDIPTPVIISEAVRLAKAYSTERSGSFVNGVLGAVADRVRG
ncbi:MAG: transcription antitermination factor NusB [Acidimicrobiia bacterium]|nr:transcription antitermination factor NusB [Acidimicrobiia bacterium]